MCSNLIRARFCIITDNKVGLVGWSIRLHTNIFPSDRLRYVEFVTGELSSGDNIVNMKIWAYGSKALILSALIHLVFCRNGKRHMFSMETCKELDCLLRFHVTAYGKHICMKFTY